MYGGDHGGRSLLSLPLAPAMCPSASLDLCSASVSIEVNRRGELGQILLGLDGETATRKNHRAAVAPVETKEITDVYRHGTALDITNI